MHLQMPLPAAASVFQVSPAGTLGKMETICPAVAFTPSTFRMPVDGSVAILTAEKISGGVSESEKPQSAGVSVMVLLERFEKALSAPAGAAA